jgi:hypothetical protein
MQSRQLGTRKREKTEFIGQVIDYSEDSMVNAQVVMLDLYNFLRLNRIKMDVKGMELDALKGSANCIVNHHQSASRSREV